MSAAVDDKRPKAAEPAIVLSEDLKTSLWRSRCPCGFVATARTKQAVYDANETHVAFTASHA